VLKERRSAVFFEGPTVKLPAKQAGALAMVLQELFTNSAKHGALAASRDGSVSITWRPVQEPDAIALELRWFDRSADATTGPITEGVGLRLIRGFVATELGGHCAFNPEPGGFVGTLLIRPEPADADQEPAI